MEFEVQALATRVRVHCTVEARTEEAARRKAMQPETVWWYADDQPDATKTITSVSHVK